MKLVLLAATSAVVALPAHAGIITQIEFQGWGQVTYAEERAFDGILIPPPVEVGDRVKVRGTIWLGDGAEEGSPPAVPANFTGDVDLSTNDVSYDFRNFAFSVIGGATGVNRTYRWPYKGGRISLADGRLTWLSLYAYDETEALTLRPAAFDHTYGFRGEGTTWGGTWTLNQPVPEPATWACLVLGFGLAGAALRRRVSAGGRLGPGRCSA